MGEINLLDFCGRGDFSRHIDKPFTRAGYTWATDGKIMLRVPERDDVPEVTDAPHAECVWTVFAGPFLPITPFKFPQATGADCYQCDGRGTEHDCPDCTCKCIACTGSGKEEDVAAVTIGDRCMNWKYAAAIMTLPAVEVEAAPAADRMHFRFDGGEGVLMLLRAGHGRPIIADLLTGRAQS